MARVNRTRFAILGMLMAGPRSGYDLKRDFDEQLGQFWAESMGQIYPTLHRLRDEALVSSSVRRRPGRPERSVYRITARGRTAFRAWLTEPAAPDTLRNELLLKVFFGNEAGSEESLAHIERYERSQLELRKLFALFEREIEQRDVSAERRLYWRIALRSGQHVNRAKLAWCRDARKLIEEHAEMQAPRGAEHV